MQSDSKTPGRTFKTVSFEAVVVGVVGVVFALAANAVSKRGLSLTRNYFPGLQSPAAQVIASSRTNTLAVGSTNAGTGQIDETTLRRLAANGLAAINGEKVLQRFQSPGFGEGRIVFVDARNDEHYAEGHIPGAYQFDHYHALDFIPTVLPVCTKAEQIVVYCGGGTCEDSESAAIMLRDIGVSREKLFVYAGGIHDWEQSGRPTESGARNSGQIRPQKK